MTAQEHGLPPFSVTAFTIRLADMMDDWDALSALRFEAERRMRGMGDGTDLARGLDRMAWYTGSDQMYVTKDDKFLVGCHALTPDGDPAFWTATEREEEALYLDSVIVHPMYGGRRISALITGHAMSEARERGMTALRLDCERGNERLRDHWALQGFSWVRDAEVPGRASGTLMEAKV